MFIPVTQPIQLREILSLARSAFVADWREQAALKRCVRGVARSHHTRMLPGREARLLWIAKIHRSAARKSGERSANTLDPRFWRTCAIHDRWLSANRHHRSTAASTWATRT